MTRIFVYGTLMSGQPNARLLSTARLVGPARTARGFRLISLGAFPAMSRFDGAGAVAGEIWEAGSATVAACDRLEGHPRFYRREEIALDDGTTVEAYLMDATRLVGHGERIRSGSWLTFLTARRGHSPPDPYGDCDGCEICDAVREEAGENPDHPADLRHKLACPDCASGTASGAGRASP